MKFYCRFKIPAYIICIYVTNKAGFPKYGVYMVYYLYGVCVIYVGDTPLPDQYVCSKILAGAQARGRNQINYNSISVSVSSNGNPALQI